MSGTVQGPLTDLERAKYASDSTLTSSIVQTRQQGDITIDSSTPVNVENATFPIEPNKSPRYVIELLEDSGGNTNQAVNGSSTAVVYEWSPDPSFGTVQVFRFNLLLVANNISDFFDYASRSVLPNGVLVENGQTGSLVVFSNLQTNLDFIQYSTATGGAGFEQQGNNTQDGQQLEIDFDPPVLADSNYIFRLTIRDDLTSLTLQQAGVFFRVIP